MIIRKENLEELLIECPKEGRGILHRWDYIKEKIPCSGVLSFSYLELEPGSEIGYHQHVDTFEVYYITKGCGEINDGGGVSAVSEGYLIMTDKGKYHSLFNNGKERLSLIAFICS